LARGETAAPIGLNRPGKACAVAGVETLDLGGGAATLLMTPRP